MDQEVNNLSRLWPKPEDEENGLVASNPMDLMSATDREEVRKLSDFWEKPNQESNI